MFIFKIERLPGYILNPNDKIVNAIIKRLGKQKENVHAIMKSGMKILQKKIKYVHVKLIEMAKVVIVVFI